MKRFFSPLVRGLLIASLPWLASCQKKPSAAAPDSQQSMAEIASTPEVLTVPPTDRFATKDVFFLTTRYSQVTSSGVINYDPGTKFHRVGGDYIGPDGRIISLSNKQLTNDLELAQKVAGQNPRVLAAIRQEITRKIEIANQRPPRVESAPLPLTAAAPSASAPRTSGSHKPISHKSVTTNASQPRRPDGRPVLVEAETAKAPEPAPAPAPGQ